MHFFCLAHVGGFAFVDFAVEDFANFVKFFVVYFVFCHNYHGDSDLVAVIGWLEVVLGVGIESHA